MVVAIKECSAGNEHTGANWVETRVFNDTTTLSEVFEWSRSVSVGYGNLILSRPQTSEQGESPATTGNIDYTAALEATLREFCNPDSIDYTLGVHIPQLAARLNAALQKQHCV